MPEEYERIWLRSRNDPFSFNEPTFYTVKDDDRLIEYVRADILASQVAPPADAVEQCDALQPNILGVPEPEDRCVKPKGHDGKHSRAADAPSADDKERARAIVETWFNEMQWAVATYSERDILIDRIAAALESQVAAEKEKVWDKAIAAAKESQYDSDAGHMWGNCLRSLEAARTDDIKEK